MYTKSTNNKSIKYRVSDVTTLNSINLCFLYDLVNLGLFCFNTN